MSGSHTRTSLAVGSLLREYREWAGYSRDTVGERVGISADELEGWEIIGVPVPLSEHFFALAEILDIGQSAMQAALSEEPRGEGRRDPVRYMPRDPIEAYEAAPALEDAIVVHGWTPDELAEALATSPTIVQAWRLGLIEMTRAEHMGLTGLVRARNEPAADEP